MLNSRVVYTAALVAAVGCAILLSHWVHLFAVNIPYWDEWALSDSLVLYGDGSLGLGHLLSQHNESRKLFPRLVMILNGRWFGWDVRLQMGLSVVIALATFVNLLLLLRKTGLSPFQQAPLVFLAGLLVFSPLQGDNYLMGIQFISFGVAWLLTSNLLIATSRMGAIGRYGTTAVLSLVATFTFANGMAVWFFTYPLLATTRRRVRQPVLDALWILAAAATLALYFWDYKTPDHHPQFASALSQPGMTLKFFCVFLGSSLGRASFLDTMPACGVIGAALVAVSLLVLAGAASLVQQRGLCALQPLLPWLAIALYGFASTAVAALGRTPFGVSEALAGRYVTVSIYAVLGLVVLAAQLRQQAWRDGLPAWRRRASARGGRVAIVLVTVLAILGVHPGYVIMKDIHETRQQVFDAFAERRVTAAHVGSIYPIEAKNFLLARFVQLSHLGYVAEPLRHFEILELVTNEGSAEESGTPKSDRATTSLDSLGLPAPAPSGRKPLTDSAE